MGIVRIIGVNDDGAESLGSNALAYIEQADLLLGGQRLLDFFPPAHAAASRERVLIRGNVEEFIRHIEATDAASVVVLASGDPSFYGIARRLVQALGKERVEIIPNVSAIQLAFARIKESWEDAKLYSVHGRDMADLVPVVRANRKIAILTDKVNSPSAIATQLLAAGLDDCPSYVCENLGSRRERIVETTLASLPGQEFSPLNVLVLLRADAAQPPLSRWTLGIPDEEFFQRKPLRGLITKAEVRVVSLAKLKICEDSVVWDIGAGSGSISIEAALLASRGQVFAVERYAEDVAIIRQNITKFGANSVTVVHGTAPEALGRLPDPDAVFVGGTGGHLRQIVAEATRRLGGDGRIVINLTTLENLAAGLAALRECGFAFEVTQVAIARGKAVGELTRLEPLDPVFILSGREASS